MGEHFKLYKDGILLVLGNGKVHYFSPFQIQYMNNIIKKWREEVYPAFSPLVKVDFGE